MIDWMIPKTIESGCRRSRVMLRRVMVPVSPWH